MENSNVKMSTEVHEMCKCFPPFFRYQVWILCLFPLMKKKVVPSVQKGCICVKIASYNLSVARSERNLEQSLL